MNGETRKIPPATSFTEFQFFLACLADLSRLIPSQYMRKGRGRVEKTEIIEMAIRHLKNLQTQEVLREATYGDHYRSGYNDCVTEAAKFLLRERDEELYYKMITHLREHMAEAMKGESLLVLRALVFPKISNFEHFRRQRVALKFPRCLLTDQTRMPLLGCSHCYACRMSNRILNGIYFCSPFRRVH